MIKVINLKKDIMKALEDVNQIYADIIKAAEESETKELDLSEATVKYSRIVRELDQKFNEALVRLNEENPSTKGGFLGFGGKIK